MKQVNKSEVRISYLEEKALIVENTIQTDTEIENTKDQLKGPMGRVKRSNILQNTSSRHEIKKIKFEEKIANSSPKLTSIFRFQSLLNTKHYKQKKPSFRHIKIKVQNTKGKKKTTTSKLALMKQQRQSSLSFPKGNVWFQHPRGHSPKFKSLLQDSAVFAYNPGMSSEKALAPHSSTLAWRIPWTEEPDGLQSMGSLRVGHD